METLPTLISFRTDAPCLKSLKDKQIRRLFEHELSMLLSGAQVSIESVSAGDAEWHSSHKRVALDTPPEEMYEGLTCSLSGG